jgi:hypothetical protein
MGVDAKAVTICTARGLLKTNRRSTDQTSAHLAI